MDLKRALIAAGVGALVGVGILYVSNLKAQLKVEALDVEKIVRILKLIRKEKFIVYKQTATFALNITRQMRNNINIHAVEQFLNGPESPIKIKDEIEKISEEVCKKEGTTSEALNNALEQFATHEDVAPLIKQQERDYQICLSGKLPPFNVALPKDITHDKFLAIQNQITKKTYLQQVAVFRKLAQYSEEELNANPALLTDLGNPDKEQEEILTEEGFGSEFEPALAVYENLTVKYLSDPSIRNRIAKVEQGYQRIMQKYGMKIQQKTITNQELNDMEEEIIFYDPMV